MVLKTSSIGLISLVILPAIFLLTLRIRGFTTDPVGLVFLLLISEGISLVLALIIMLQIKRKTKAPVLQT